jgi:hypothetical protein
MFDFVKLLSKEFLIVVEIIDLVLVTSRTIRRLAIRQIYKRCTFSRLLSPNVVLINTLNRAFGIITVNFVYFSN